ncbi:glycosyltransferase family 1 protein [Thalassotalea psychrophila]|uniref:Glycosyltransferase family 1 protein n=1 Tax=Thalassotalea psychrophila TaxID=3065647 RepID=A0ABY9TRZ7_9GAMM|nr:glycosyltransferase family 1 protein [Colwelliaceae bacterium SQ149]
MKVAYDGNIFLSQKYGGISRYFNELFCQFDQQQEINYMVFSPLFINSYLHQVDPSIVYGKKINKIPNKMGRLLTAYNLLLSNSAMKKWQPDLIHETYYSNFNVGNKSCPKVITVHDMIHEIYPSSFLANDPTAKYKRNAINRADHIIAASENTKKDLINIAGVTENKISVVHHGVSPIPGEAKTVPEAFDGSFLLYVGLRQGYKNFENLIKAYASSPNLKSDFTIVTFGGGAFSKGELNLFKQLKIPHNCIINMQGNDQQLKYLYTKAAAFVYPSLYEGFGMPPLEAMCYNCPVISSNSSSIPEVVGNAAYFFNPLDIEDLVYAIQQVVYSDQIRENLIKRGQQQRELFSWQRCASQTLDVYNRFSKS